MRTGIQFAESLAVSVLLRSSWTDRVLVPFAVYFPSRSVHRTKDTSHDPFEHLYQLQSYNHVPRAIFCALKPIPLLRIRDNIGDDEQVRPRCGLKVNVHTSLPCDFRFRSETKHSAYRDPPSYSQIYQCCQWDQRRSEVCPCHRRDGLWKVQVR